MKKLVAMLLALAMVLSLAACGAKAEETTAAEAAVEETEAEETTAAEAAVEETEAEPNGEYIDGLEVNVNKIFDRSNVVVRFNKDLFGYTDTPNYKITDADGNELELVSANSAFFDLGGEIPNVFRLVFTEPLEPGTYKIVVSNIVDAIDGPYHNFYPAECELVITEDIPESAE